MGVKGGEGMGRRVPEGGGGRRRRIGGPPYSSCTQVRYEGIVRLVSCNLIRNIVATLVV